MAEILKKFSLSDIDNKALFHTNIETYLLDNGLTSLIHIETGGVGNSKTLDISYREVSDDGNFVTFGGLLVNTSSGYVCMGYNGYKEGYIPIVDLKELLTASIWGDNKTPYITKEALLYIVESIKLNHDKFELLKYLKDLESGVTTGKDSLILNYILTKNQGISISNGIIYRNDEEIYTLLMLLFTNILNHMDALGKEFFGNFISEKNKAEVMNNVANRFKTADLKDGGNESLYIKAIRDRGADPIFVRELSSIGLGKKRRDGITSSINTGLKPPKSFAILSSWAFITVWDSSSYTSLTDDKIKSYNILDMLKGLDREHDLYFSYDIMNQTKSDKFLTTLIQKLNLTAEIQDIGGNTFLKHVTDFARNMSLLKDMGSTYAFIVKPEQKDFLTFSIKEMANGGKILEKGLKRITSKF